jgi:hypothetical protein
MNGRELTQQLSYDPPRAIPQGALKAKSLQKSDQPSQPLSERVMSSGVIQVPMSSVTISAERSQTILGPDAALTSSDVVPADENLHPTTSALARHTVDDFPEGGYGWIVVLACGAIRYARSRLHSLEERSAYIVPAPGLI